MKTPISACLEALDYPKKTAAGFVCHEIYECESTPEKENEKEKGEKVNLKGKKLIRLNLNI